MVQATLLLVLVAATALATAYPQTDRKMHSHRVSSASRKNIRAEETDAEFWNNMAQATLAAHVARPLREGVAKNVIMFLGDGLSIPTLTATRILKGGEQSALVWEDFPGMGLSKTYCVDSMVADSACSTTAYLGGVKANDATIGVTGAVLNKDCAAQQNTSNHVISILRKAQLAGKSTGVVTNTRITHATPAGAYAHTAERDWESDYDLSLDGVNPDVCDDIAEQLIRGETGPNLNVILGGGRNNFRDVSMSDEEGQSGRRRDGADLIAEWQVQKTAAGASWGWAWDRSSLQAINLASTNYLLGLFEASHMEYNLDNNPALKPSLPEMVQAAITLLSRNPNGFVLFVEGGRIDHAHHETRAQRALDETLQLERAVVDTLGVTDPNETLIVVTADHAHTMALQGYPNRGGSLFGISLNSDVDSKPMSVLSYANGPGYKNPGTDGSRYDITNDNFADSKYEYPSLAPLSSETHGGDDVAVFALGPWAHLFSGTYEQNFIEHAVRFASCLGEGLSACGPKRH